MGNMTQTRSNSMRLHGTAIALLAIATIAGCRENPLIPEGNSKPQANAGDDMTLDFSGTPVTVELDGRGSSDDDGEIVEYVWLSGTPLPAQDAGMGMEPVVPGGRLVPEGEEATWPDDEARPTVVLGEGVWNFSLWVRDDSGALSAPDSVTIFVGSSADPVAECAATVASVVADPCKECLCGLDDMCKMAVAETACNADCWALISCVGANCPDFAAMAAMMDYTCLTTNCSAELAAGMAGATPAGACARMCPEACAPMM
jgi:hypothetical protein